MENAELLQHQLSSWASSPNVISSRKFSAISWQTSSRIFLYPHRRAFPWVSSWHCLYQIRTINTLPCFDALDVWLRLWWPPPTSASVSSKNKGTGWMSSLTVKTLTDLKRCQHPISNWLQPRWLQLPANADSRWQTMMVQVTGCLILRWKKWILFLVLVSACSSSILQEWTSRGELDCSLPLR